MKIGRVHLEEGEGRTIRNFRRIFHFENGAHIEVSYHHGRGCWMAQRETNSSATYGFGVTRRAAIRNLRENIAMRVVARIEPPDRRVVFDELSGAPDEIWETFKK